MLLSLTVNNTFLIPGSLRLPGFFHWINVFHSNQNFENLKKLSDDQCMNKVASGMEPAFQVLFERYSELVYGYCVKIVKDKERAEDASQDVWVKVIKNANRYKSQGQFKAWLMQITRNTCFSLFRDLKKNNAEDVSEHEVEDISQQDILDLMSIEEDKMKLKACIDKLPKNQRLALIVWMTEEKSYEEIAKELETSISSVKSLLFRSRQSLKEMMSENHG